MNLGSNGVPAPLDASHAPKLTLYAGLDFGQTGVAFCRVTVDSDSSVSPGLSGKDWQWELVVDKQHLRTFGERIRIRDNFERVLEVLGSANVPVDAIRVFDGGQRIDFTPGSIRQTQIKYVHLENPKGMFGL